MQLREFVDTLKLGEIIKPYVASRTISRAGGGDAIPTGLEDITGWCDDTDVMRDLVIETTTTATSIIELGSWEGLSAAVLAETSLLGTLDATVLCVDTWLGSAEHVGGGAADNYSRIRPYGSTLPLLGNFLRNMSGRLLDHTVFPFPATTSVAAAVLRRHSVLVDLVYIDASHEYEDVLRDLRDYWGIVRPGGVLFGDDYSPEWDGVMRAVETFKREIVAPDGQPEIRGRKFIFRKPTMDWKTKVHVQVRSEDQKMEVDV